MKKFTLLLLLAGVMAPKLYAPLDVETESGSASSTESAEELARKISAFVKKYNILEKKMDSSVAKVVKESTELIDETRRILESNTKKIAGFQEAVDSTKLPNDAINLIADLFTAYRSINAGSASFIRAVSGLATDDFLGDLFSAKIHKNATILGKYEKVQGQLRTILKDYQTAFNIQAIVKSRGLATDIKGIGKEAWGETKDVLKVAVGETAKEGVRGFFDLVKGALGIKGSTPTGELTTEQKQKIEAQRVEFKEKLEKAEVAYTELESFLNEKLDTLVKDLGKVSKILSPDGTEKREVVDNLQKMLTKIQTTMNDTTAPAKAKLQFAVEAITPYREETKIMLSAVTTLAKALVTFAQNTLSEEDASRTEIETTQSSFEKTIKKLLAGIEESNEKIVPALTEIAKKIETKKVYTILGSEVANPVKGEKYYDKEGKSFIW